MMQRYRLSMQYMGTKYCGWAKQSNNSNSIQEKLENIFLQFTGDNILVHGSSRTDVHALCNTAHVDLKRWNPHIKEYQEPYDEEELLKILNSLLKDTDILITSVKKVPETFHVKDSFERTYIYRMVISKYKIPFLKDRVYTAKPRAYNFDLMKSEAQKLVGSHDFYSFSTLRSFNGFPQDTNREMKQIEITEHDLQDELTYQQPLKEIRFKFVAPRFLYHQIRITVGHLLRIALGVIEPNTEHLLKIKCDQTRKYLVPPEGLYLKEVKDGY